MGRRSRKRSAITATTAAKPAPFDKYYHYTDSVQLPQQTARFLSTVYSEAQGRERSPITLREDFCGTFAICCEWVKLDGERRAVGVDIDPEPIAYGRSHYLPKLAPHQQERVQILQENVLSPHLPKADVIAALNFSYLVFKARAELWAYFRNCCRTLEPGGVLVLDCLGGPFRQRPNVQKTDRKQYSFFFEQERFDPLSHDVLFQMHFKRRGESIRRNVFTYDWRLWTLPELRDALLDAGFARTGTYWKGTNAERAEKWNCYVVGLR